MQNNTSYVLVIGGANVDFTGFPYQSLIWHDSNPGSVETSLGGVGRNIAENLARLGVPTKLLSVVGDDFYGDKLIKETQATGVDVSAVEKIANQRTSTYFSIMNTDEDMAVAIADMEIVDSLTPEKIKKHIDLIEHASIVVLDTNLPKKTLQFLLLYFPKTRFFIDTVSVTKANKVQSLLEHIDTIKSNRLEIEYLTGIKVKDVNDAKQAAKKLIEQGVKNVFVSIGEKGIVYGNSNNEYYHSPVLPTQVINTAGAGDAIMAGMVYGTIEKLPVLQLLRVSNAAAAITLMSKASVSLNLSVSAIDSLLKNNLINTYIQANEKNN